MNEVLSVGRLQALAAASTVACKLDLEASLRRSGNDVQVSVVPRASDLLPAYRVRLSRWEAVGKPASVGVPEYVKALEDAGDAPVALAGWHVASDNFQLLLSGDLDVLLAAIKFERPWREPSNDRPGWDGGMS